MKPSVTASQKCEVLPDRRRRAELVARRILPSFRAILKLESKQHTRLAADENQVLIKIRSASHGLHRVGFPKDLAVLRRQAIDSAIVISKNQLAVPISQRSDKAVFERLLPYLRAVGKVQAIDVSFDIGQPTLPPRDHRSPFKTGLLPRLLPKKLRGFRKLSRNKAARTGVGSAYGPLLSLRWTQYR